MHPFGKSCSAYNRARSEDTELEAGLDLVAFFPIETSEGVLDRAALREAIRSGREHTDGALPSMQRFEILDDDHALCIETWPVKNSAHRLYRWTLLVRLKTTSTPYFGVPYFDQWGIVGGHTSAYRWHINDPLVFNTGIKVTLEHFGWISPDENPRYKSTSWNEREDDYASVAFWYQTGRSTFSARAPRERALPSLERVISYARDQLHSERHGSGDVTTQQLEVHPGPQLLYSPQQAEGAWLEIPFEVERKEPLRLLVTPPKSYAFGRYRVKTICWPSILGGTSIY